MLHVLPVDDWIEHREDTTCVCNPTIETAGGEMLVIHNAVDGREENETNNISAGEGR